ncbi:hypothetical protein CBL_20174 [Carabus blaptoides fortunei]
MAKIAKIEAASKAGAPKLKEMEQATGLTAHMVRYRREKPEYKKFLEIAIKERKEAASKIFQSRPPSSAPKATPSSPMASTSRPNIPTIPNPTCFPPSPTQHVSPTPSVATSFIADTPDGNILTTTNKRKASTSPAAATHLKTRPRTEPGDRLVEEGSAPVVDVPTTPPAVTAGIPSKRKREAGSPSGTPSPQRPRTQRLNSSPADLSEHEMTSLTTSPTTTEGRTRSTSEADLSTADEGSRTNHALSACGTDVSILQELTRLRGATDPATKHIIDTAFQADIASLDQALQSWMCEIFPPCHSTRQQRGHPNDGRRGPPVRKPTQITRKQDRAARYKKCQDLFRHKRTQLAHDIIDGKDPSCEITTPSIQAVEDLYRGIFESPSPPDPEPVTPEPHISVHLPVSEDDIEAATSTWKHSAPGPDGITVAQVKRCPRQLLCSLFNIVLYRRFTPSFWRESRTILIEKDGDRSDPANWRPITIGSAVQRLLHRILARRLMSAIDLHPLQRGFRDVDGGSVTNETRIAAMGVADDIVLMEDKDSAMALSLANCSQFFNARGMSINPTKSVSVSAATVKGISVPRTKPLFKIQGHPIAKRILHLSGHTGNQMLHASLRDGGLGITQLRMKIPALLDLRIKSLFRSDTICASLKKAEPTASFIDRVARLAKKGLPDSYWREQISIRSLSAGLEAASEDRASRSWLTETPPGWTGRDYVRAVQLRTSNLPCRGLPSNPVEQRMCRAGCEKVESLSHILQGCTVTHFERIKRHDEIVSKIAKHARTAQWTCEQEPRVCPWHMAPCQCPNCRGTQNSI